MKRFEGLNSIDKDSYFIRLSDKKDHFIHFEGDNPNDRLDKFNPMSKYPPVGVTYRVIKGEKGACIWHKKEAEKFIESVFGRQNIEMVKVTDVLKNIK